MRRITDLHGPAHFTIPLKVTSASKNRNTAKEIIIYTHRV